MEDLVFPKESKILVVDDMRVMRRLVSNFLRSMGYHNLIEGGDGEDAMRHLVTMKREKTPIDLVIIDWNMPQTDGIEFLQRVRNHDDFSKLPVIFVTAEADANHIAEAKRVGVDAYITKPFELDELKRQMSNVFKKKRLAQH